MLLHSPKDEIKEDRNSLAPYLYKYVNSDSWLNMSLGRTFRTDALMHLIPMGTSHKWDVISWTPDGYVAVVTMFNFQYRGHIQAPRMDFGMDMGKEGDPKTAVSSFQVSVGAAGTTNKTVRVPKNFTLKAPGPGYTCRILKLLNPLSSVTNDGRRVTQAMMTWNVTCTYSQFLAQKTPTCCVSLSSFYNDTIARAQHALVAARGMALSMEIV
ncbi:hypothetical protein HAX54_009082 [Datura stramonium]|uniref:Uncharacterized protein n=1 Tax=Datura stramonium TaxID=4076 RepID=A0ABS8RVZ6_DATST|nr:hypothetical protein [Datura stramonium]